MADLIDRQDAIDAVKEAIISDEWEYAEKALESLPSAQTETCEDAVSREAIMKHYDSGEILHVHHVSRNNLLDFIESLPSVTPKERQWIPCSERLPERVKKTYWVCLESGGQCQCRWTNDMYGLGANKWSEWEWHVMDKPQYSVIIAWRELPEPYREEGEK